MASNCLPIEEFQAETKEMHVSPPDVHRKPDDEDQSEFIDLGERAHLKILVTGRTGSGKSTIINGILGLKEDAEGAAVEGNNVGTRCTYQVTKFATKINGVMIDIWDTPGLQDGQPNQQDYIDDIEQKCSTRNLTLYCINASAVRFVRGNDNVDLVSMKKLTDKFGAEFWTNAVIILTFANIIVAVNPKWARLSQDEKAEQFEKKIDEWQTLIRSYLKEFVEVPLQVADNISILPAGYHDTKKLGDREYWLSDLWLHCLKTISSPEGQRALYVANINRVTTVPDATEEEPNEQEDLSRQRIYITAEQDEEIIKKIKKQGATLGAFLGILGGPFMFATIPMGYYFGKKVGKRYGKEKMKRKQEEAEDILFKEDHKASKNSTM